MRRPRALHAAWPAAGVGVLTILLALGGLHCGAEGTKPPPDPEEEAAGTCVAPSRMMPELFALLRHPARPLSPLRDLVAELSAEEGDGLVRNPIAGMLDAVVRGLRLFASDPDESRYSRCVEVPPARENRMCAVRRALDFGVRDAAAAEALDRLTPLLVQVVGYVSNHGPGADGREHYEAISILRRTAMAEDLCSPANLIDVLDSLVTWWRPDARCMETASGEHCPALRAVILLRELLSDAALQEFLKAFETADGEKARAAVQKLGRLVLEAFATMPADETYFDRVDDLINRILVPFLDLDPARYGELKRKVLESVEIAREFLDPFRPGAVLPQIKSVTECTVKVDKQDELVGALYDLLLRPAEGQSVDVVGLATVLEDLVRLDARSGGVLFGFVHTLLEGTRADPEGMDSLRRLLVELLEVKRARRIMPVLQLLIEREVLVELMLAVDNLLYGCRDR